MNSPAAHIGRPKRIGFSLLSLLLIVSGLSAISVAIPETAVAASVRSGSCFATIDTTSGVAITESGGNCYVAFKNATTYQWTVPAGVSSIDYLVVAGGGSGGARHGAGGGAGGMLSETSVSVSGITTLNVTVGDGGAAVAPTGTNYAVGLAGSNSALTKNSGAGSFTTVTAVGGGGGGAGGVGLQNGGSGGGAQSATVSSGTAGQGNAGGQGGQGGGIYWSGGGGGKSAAGADGTNTKGGNGGAGSVWISTFTTTVATALSLAQTGQTSGDQVYFAGGGGGSIAGGATPVGGSGGLGGGGDAKVGVYVAGIAGTANSGGGGGGTGCCEPINF